MFSKSIGIKGFNEYELFAILEAMRLVVDSQFNNLFV